MKAKEFIDLLIDNGKGTLYSYKSLLNTIKSIDNVIVTEERPHNEKSQCYGFISFEINIDERYRLVFSKLNMDEKIKRLAYYEKGTIEVVRMFKNNNEIFAWR